MQPEGGASAPRKRVASDAIDKAARLLRLGRADAGDPRRAGAQRAGARYAGAIAGKTACRIATQFFSARLERGAGRVPLERIPYAVDQALAMLKPFRHIITVCTDEPIAFFAYPNKPSLLEARRIATCSSSARWTRIARRRWPISPMRSAPKMRIGWCSRWRRSRGPSGALNPENLAQALLATMPEGCILVDESVTTGRESFGVTAGAAPHDNLQNMGGSIGFGTPVSTGAAIACPDRPVLCIVGDGSAMYTIQSLWTQVREGLNVTTVVCANRSYQILKNEFKAVGAGVPGSNALSMLDIDNPTLDFVALAKGMGMSATTGRDAPKIYAARSSAAWRHRGLVSSRHSFRSDRGAASCCGRRSARRLFSANSSRSSRPFTSY